MLDPSDTVQDPGFPEVAGPGVPKRVCESCYDETNAAVPARLQGTRTLSRIVVDQGRLSVPHGRDTASQISDLAEYDLVLSPHHDYRLTMGSSCPVCYQNLNDLGDASAQEAHVKSCLEGGAGTSPKSAKYLVYKLPGESPLIGIECKTYRPHPSPPITDHLLCRCNMLGRIHPRYADRSSTVDQV
jgi:hypothetical protein